ncbi:hypothetical protein [Methylocella silvestris]|uniref:hypothetical protein n=1 Tax=Methylocella silvestris TaxID=199596 RepID=UPI0011AFD167|nr:hypothetical protein [Methylocella silvestris]
MGDDGLSVEERRSRWADVIARLFFEIPGDFFLSVEALLEPDCQFRPAGLALIGNLLRAATVASLPYTMASSEVMQRRYSQLLAAESIRQLNYHESPLNEEAQAKAAEIAHRRMREETEADARREFPWAASATLSNLESRLHDEKFSAAAADLLRSC